MSSSAVNSRVRLSADELHQLCWLLGLGLSLLAFWTLLSVKIGSLTWMWLLAGGSAIAASLVMPGLPGLLPAGFWRVVVPVSVVLFALDFVMSRGDVVPSLVRMVTLLILFRCLQYRRRREDMQLVLMCLFTTVLSGVLTSSPLFGVQILLFSMMALALLLTLVLLESSATRALTRGDWKHFNWSRFLARLARALDLRLLLLCGVLFVAMVMVSTVIFVAMPRFSFDQAFTAMQLHGQSGFNDSISFSRLSNEYDNSIAFHVDPPPGVTLSASNPPYWRMIVMDEYSVSESDSSLNAFRCSLFPPMPERERAVHYIPEMIMHLGGASRSTGPWKIYLEGNVSEYLPILGPFTALTFSSPQSMRASSAVQVYRLPEPSSKVLGYQLDFMDNAEAILENPDAENLNRLKNLKAAEQIDAFSHPQYPLTLKALPPQADDRAVLKRIVQENKLDEGNITAVEFSRRAVEYLRRTHPTGMSVNVPTADKDHDPLVNWMDSHSPGWCEHFAGSFVFLARAAGRPARVVAGFKGATYNAAQNYYVVRNDRAHAWAEIFDGKDRWLRVDPTPDPQNPLAGIPTEATENPGPLGEGRHFAAAGATTDAKAAPRLLPAETGFSAQLDSLRMLWYRRVINFDQADQLQMVDKVTEFGHRVADFLRKQYAAAREWFAELVLHPFSASHVFPLLLALAVMAVVVGFRRTFFNLWLRLNRRGWLARLNRQNPVRRRAGRWLLRFHPVWRARVPMLLPDQQATWNSARDELLALRYGPLEAMPDPVRAFRQARWLLRQARRQPLL